MHVSTFRLVSQAKRQKLASLDRGAIVSFVFPALYLAILLLIIFGDIYESSLSKGAGAG